MEQHYVWLEANGQRRPATVQMLRDKFQALCIVFGSDKNVHELTRADLVAYAETRTKQPVKNSKAGLLGRTVSLSTVEKELDHLCKALKIAKEKGLYHGDVEQLWPKELLRNASKPRERVLSKDEFRVVYAKAPSTFRDHLYVIAHTGMDRGELVRLTPTSLQPGTRSVLVPGTKTDARPRNVPVTTKVWEILTRRAEGLKPDASLFPCEPSSITTALRHACTRAKVPHANLKDLRRSFASWAGNAGMPESELIRLMGHSSSRMIRRVYQKLSTERLRQAMDVFEGYVEDH